MKTGDILLNRTSLHKWKKKITLSHHPLQNVIFHLAISWDIFVQQQWMTLTVEISDTDATWEGQTFKDKEVFAK